MTMNLQRIFHYSIALAMSFMLLASFSGCALMQDTEALKESFAAAETKQEEYIEAYNSWQREVELLKREYHEAANEVSKAKESGGNVAAVLEAEAQAGERLRTAIERMPDTKVYEVATNELNEIRGMLESNASTKEWLGWGASLVLGLLGAGGTVYQRRRRSDIEEGARELAKSNAEVLPDRLPELKKRNRERMQPRVRSALKRAGV